MLPIFSKKSRFLYLPLLFLVIFASSAIFYVAQSAKLDIRQFQTHATIISADVWALNNSGVKAYLDLAIKANHYQSITVSIPGNENFITITSPPLTGISEFFSKIRLTPLKPLTEDIQHDGLNIGQLHGLQYVRVIFPLLNLLVFLLLVHITGVFIVYLYQNRKYLEQQIIERTANLAKSEKRFHDLVDLLPEMVLETDLHGRIIYANKAAKDRFQIASSTDQPPVFWDFVAKEEHQTAKSHFRDSLHQKTTRLQELTARDFESKSFPILVRTAPIKNTQEIIGARMIVIDITERYRYEEQLRRDQKMKAIGLMAGGVAHDLNNILSGIISYPELLLLDLDSTNKMRRPLETIRKAGLDAAEVVSDLLTVARGIAANREIVNPNTLIHDYLASPDFQQLCLRFPLIKIESNLAPDLRNISCSPIHIRKCLMNLTTNGMEAIQDKGELKIFTANHRQSDTLLPNDQHLPEGQYTKIIVYDNGSGIAPHEIEHIFEPFYSKKVMGRSGTGLGLAVVWNTVRDHGGIVIVKSNIHGTTFELFFPSVEDMVVSSSDPQNWQSFKGKGETVLVIDDEERQRDIARELLKKLNYTVVTMPSGEAAVEYLQTHSADLLVLDMIMDPGQNGRATYERILQLYPGQKAIIASGYAEDDDVRATLAMGAGAFISKPYTLEKIGQTIYKILSL